MATQTNLPFSWDEVDRISDLNRLQLVKLIFKRFQGAVTTAFSSFAASLLKAVGGPCFQMIGWGKVDGTVSYLEYDGK